MRSNECNQTGLRSQVLSSLVDGSYLKTGLSLSLYENAVGLFDETVFKPKKRGYVSMRSTVDTFSKSSRRRMFNTLSKMRFGTLTKGKMLTLTYHENFDRPVDELKKDFSNFLQWLRDNIDGAHYMWRVEFQKRGAIHYHVLVWAKKGDRKLHSKSFDLRASRAWHQIADPTSVHHERFGFDSKTISDYRHACSYVSKYVAKVSEEREVSYRGRRWATSVGFPVGPVAEVELSRQGFRLLQKLIVSLLAPHVPAGSKFLYSLEEAKDVLVYMTPSRLLTGLHDSMGVGWPPEEYSSLCKLLREIV